MLDYSITRAISFSGQSLAKKRINLLLATFVLLCGGAASAATTVGLTIENDTDSNGIITVVQGTRVVVSWEVLANDEKLLNKKDVIELLRADDSVVASAVRGKGNSGKVALKVKKSVGEELYVRYRVKKDGSIPSKTPDLTDPDRVPLMTIAGANLDELAIRMNALENVPVETYAIGDVGPAGGWVFHVTDGGLHGLEAAPEDQGVVAWGCIGTNLPGAAGEVIGTGGQNTGDILTACMEANIAARKARNYWLNDYNDWYLPSLQELVKLGASLTPGGPTEGNKYLLESDWYHSSTEAAVNNPAERAYIVMLNGNPGSFASDNKDNLRLVRAIRAF